MEKTLNEVSSIPNPGARIAPFSERGPGARNKKKRKGAAQQFSLKHHGTVAQRSEKGCRRTAGHPLVFESKSHQGES